MAPDRRSARLAVVGFGAIGRRHVEAMGEVAGAELAAIVEPVPQAAAAAAGLGVPVFADIAGMLAAVAPDGVIVATPNSTHLPLALACIAAGVPVLVEKPVTDEVASAYRLADAAELAGVPVLVGHHRRHSAIVQQARQIVGSGVLGKLTAIQGTFLVRKPDDYYRVAWRRMPGGGPVLINMIHDIDSLRFIAGEIVAVQGLISSRRRGNAVEDTAAALLSFASGAIGTLTLSDATPTPWSWEQTAGERSSYTFPRYDADCYHIAGTRGALAVPSLRLWTSDDPRGWLAPLQESTAACAAVDPASQQLAHFLDVIDGAPPLVGARDGARTLEVTLAIADSARRHTRIDLPVPG